MVKSDCLKYLLFLEKKAAKGAPEGKIRFKAYFTRSIESILEERQIDARGRSENAHATNCQPQRLQMEFGLRGLAGEMYSAKRVRDAGGVWS